jgi:hypothetical protein
MPLYFWPPNLYLLKERRNIKKNKEKDKTEPIYRNQD